MIELLDFMVSVAKFMKKKVERHFLEKAKVAQFQNLSKREL